MQSLQSKLSVSAMTAYFGIFQEPRGFIRLLQFIFAIFAFATACNGRSSVSARVAPGTDLMASWSYPYNMEDTPIYFSSNNSSPATIFDSNNVKPSAEFFVFTGVTSMLWALAMAILYVVMDQQYRNNDRLPLADFIVTIIWTIFWLVGSSAWAQGVSKLRSQTQWENIADRAGACRGPNTCALNYPGSYASVTVSVIFGFLNFLLWLGSVWFVCKETRLYKSRTQQQQQQQPAQENSFANMSSPAMQAPPHTRAPGSMG